MDALKPVLTRHNGWWLLADVIVLLALLAWFSRPPQIKRDAQGRIVEWTTGKELTPSDLVQGIPHIAEKLSEPTRRTTYGYGDGPGNEFTNGTISYSYDAAGNRILNANPSGTSGGTVTFRYEGTNRIAFTNETPR